MAPQRPLRFLRGLSLSALVGVANIMSYLFFFTRIVLRQQFPVLHGIFFLLENRNTIIAIPLSPGAALLRF